MNQKNLSRYFFIAILIGATVTFVYMVRMFLVPILLAAVFTTLFYPMYEWFVRSFRGRRAIAALVCCVLLLLAIILPILGIANLVTLEAIDVYHTAEAKISALMAQGQEGLLGRITESTWVRKWGLDKVNWRGSLQEAAKSAGSILATVINKTSRGTLQVLVLLFTTLFTMFYFFRDGKNLLRKLRYLIPLDREYKNAIAARFSSVARATVKGTILIALVQGTLAGLTLWIFGVGSPFLWGVVATLFAIIPLVGAWLVLYPAAFIQMATGNLAEGIGILLVTVIVIVNVDNLLRPRLVGQEAGMHDLMVFFSTLGGIGMFGAMGFIIGPMIAALFLTMLDIYSEEFKEDLDGTMTVVNEQAVVVVVADPHPPAPSPASPAPLPGRGGEKQEAV
ncbi:MAG TPA: AI-2E family transporter [Thermoanaerobaculia bacterium]|nr:AI-2E family transporter [Thermoanaerobaculia bacterium]